jgi:CMP-N-acetylneuraminic acid synthetase
MILGLIIAKETSLRCPKKNIKKMNKLERTLPEAVAEIAYWSNLDVTALSSSSQRILNLYLYTTKRIKRPEHLDSDETSICDIVNHALDYLNTYTFEAVMLLQPTNPLIDEEDINSVIKLHKDGLSVVSGKYSFIKNEDTLGAKNIFQRDGSIILTSVENIRKGILLPKEHLKYELPFHRCIDINDENDWKMAELLLDWGGKN